MDIMQDDVVEGEREGRRVRLLDVTFSVQVPTRLSPLVRFCFSSVLFCGRPFLFTWILCRTAMETGMLNVNVILWQWWDVSINKTIKNRKEIS